MKGKKCPYCGRKISYFTVFHEKKHGIYECARCKKESKIKIDKKLLILFIALVLAIIVYIIFWFGSGNYNNPLGIIPPAVALIIFYFCSPLFIRFVPLKRFLSIDNKKPEAQNTVETTGSTEDFVFDKKIFDEIKNKRRSQSSIEERIDKILEEDPYVPVIEDVSEAHTSSSQAPLKRVTRAHAPEPTAVYKEEDVKKYVPHKEKPNGSTYTANRKF